MIEIQEKDLEIREAQIKAKEAQDKLEKEYEERKAELEFWIKERQDMKAQINRLNAEVAV